MARRKAEEEAEARQAAEEEGPHPKLAQCPAIEARSKPQEPSEAERKRAEEAHAAEEAAEAIS